MLLQATISSSPPLQHQHHHHHHHPHSLVPFGSLQFRPHRLSLQALFQHYSSPDLTTFRVGHGLNVTEFPDFQVCVPTISLLQCLPSSLGQNFSGLKVLWRLCEFMLLGVDLFAVLIIHTPAFISYVAFHRAEHGKELAMGSYSLTKSSSNLWNIEDNERMKRVRVWASVLSFGQISLLTSAQVAHAGESIKPEAIYEEQVRSGDATATGLFELGAVMLRRKYYPAATKYLLQAIEKWDGDDQDLAQVYNALGVSYVLDGKLDKGIKQFEAAVKLQPGYVTAWNNLGDAYEKKKDLKSALKAFEEVLLFDPNNKVARPRRDALKDKVQMYRGVPIKSKDR
ncbi:hypothetical protein POTOM_058441 [Populus tomentosa]|uniref:Tetratricopeptide repeat (TPR)-like superfamily protein n=1 Tax=Populus tomentosa TaxID=118781 RepID=A0A8X8C3Y7_POPTO|nr:hypothetical protein POTOM_058441 [Populus tomentosa]